MKSYLLIVPVALLVAFSQLVVKWRASIDTVHVQSGWLARLLAFMADPIMLSGYAAALVASFAWLFVVARLPLATAFPIYIGLTFLLVIFGSYLLLDEPLNLSRVLAAVLIFAGIVVGMAGNG